MTYFLIAIAVLLAVLVGVAVPTLLQLRTTLASAQKFLDTTGPQVERTLVEVTTAAERIQRVATEAEERVAEAKEILRSTMEIVAKAGRLRAALRTAAAVGNAIGPALAAAATAFFVRPSRPAADMATPPPATGEPAAEEAAGAFRKETRS